MTRKLTGAINPAVPTFAKKGENPSFSKKFRREVPRNRKMKKEVRYKIVDWRWFRSVAKDQ